jgi:hypothetical protein
MAYTTIPKSTVQFAPEIYTGNGSNKTISTLNFQPDWVWIKNRATTDMNVLFDSLRGATKRIASDSTAAEATEAQDLTAFNTNGFTVSTSGAVNSNSVSYASWNWKGGTTSGIATNGDTDITPSSYSFNQTSGFSIIRYTGIGGQPIQIPHGLGVQPKMFIIKRLNSTGSWGVLPQQISTGHLYLDAVSALSTVNPLSGGVLADTVNFSVSNSGDVNASGGTYVAYCFADVQGFSKMSSYTGNASTDGTFVYTGFKPAFVMLKNSASSGTDWQIYDDKRLGYNGGDRSLAPNTTAAEETGQGKIDFLSNGFKLRTTSANQNASALYVYMAFAEEPLVSTNGNAATAR